ncbi:MAG: BlaI/MecI/CopY family transcriptional regulator [Gemmatimonadota bacterium]
MTKRRPGLSRRERQIMDVLHRRGEAAVAEVMEDMPDPPSYSAVRATLRILEEKGHVVHREDGPRYVYAPAVPREEARKAALRHVVRTFFGGSAEEAAVALLGMSDVAMTDGDLERLTAEIERAREEGR